MYNNSANQDLLNQINQLRQQVTSLQASIEQLQHDNAQLKQSAQDQYLDLDSRLNRLEGQRRPGPAARSGERAEGRTGPGKARSGGHFERPPSVHGDAGSLAATGDERTSYNVAFDALKAGRYDDSAQLFLSFLELYPNGVYAPNALYWLGESYYATRNFPMAETQFRELLSRYPTHDKAAGGLLKIGLSQYGEGRSTRPSRRWRPSWRSTPVRTPRAPRRTACSPSAWAGRSADPLSGRTIGAL